MTISVVGDEITEKQKKDLRNLPQKIIDEVCRFGLQSIQFDIHEAARRGIEKAINEGNLNTCDIHGFFYGYSGGRHYGIHRSSMPRISMFNERLPRILRGSIVCPEVYVRKIATPADDLSWLLYPETEIPIKFLRPKEEWFGEISHRVFRLIKELSYPERPGDCSWFRITKK